jgi:hypothetical protein
MVRASYKTNNKTKAITTLGTWMLPTLQSVVDNVALKDHFAYETPSKAFYKGPRSHVRRLSPAYKFF